MAGGTIKKAGNVFVWGLMGLLILGLTGFGISNFGGAATAVGSVGDREITAEQYFRALNVAIDVEEASLNAPMTFAEAQARGIPAQVRGQLAAAAALDGETARLGFSVGDDVVAKQILQRPDFAGLDGKFDREAYEFMLGQRGLTVPEFEQTIRDETARQLVQGAVVGGIAPPDVLIDTLLGFVGERRSFRWVTYDASTLDTPLPEPTDADLTAYYEADPEAFTLPQMKRISYVWLTPEQLADDVDVDPDMLRALYDERLDQFIVPERRLVERLVFPDAAAAVEAKAKIDAGEASFADAVADRGLTLGDVDMGEVSESDLGQAGTAVFELTEPGVVGPYPTDLGPALFQMNGILNGQETSFEDAQPELRHELALERAARVIDDQITDIDDRLAGGATLEDLADETDMQLGQIDFWDGSDEGIAAYNKFREAASTLTDGAFPEILGLDDGGIFAMRLDEVLPPRLQDMKEVRPAVIDGWKAAETIKLLKARADTAIAQLAVGGQIGDDGMPVATADRALRDTFIEGAPFGMMERVFDMQVGDAAVVEGPDSVVMVRLDAIDGPDMEDPRILQAQQALRQQTAQGLASDVFQIYARALMDQAGISFNDAGLNAVHSQISR